MKIIKSKLFRPQKCEFGKFALQPDAGWKVSYTFIDFESGLLVVSISDENENNWEDLGYNGRRIPTKQFIIDVKKVEILSPVEWSTYFNYEKVVFSTDDGKFRLSTQRIHEPEDNTDLICEELEFLDTGHKGTSTGVAFRKEKRENLLEYMYRDIKEKDEQKKMLDAKLTLDEFYEEELHTLREYDVIIGYMDGSNTYRLTFSTISFILSVCPKLPSEYGSWKSLEFIPRKTYSDLNAFWEDFTRDEKWFLNFRIHQSISEKPLVLAKYIISFFNNLRKEHTFSFKEYTSINQWESSVWSEAYKRTELKQWCANCYQEVYYQARYPKYICSTCASKEILDKEANILSFSNLGFSGGFKIVRKNRAGQILEEDESQQFCDCIIDNKLFFAQEARFGGIVIQRKE